MMMVRPSRYLFQLSLCPALEFVQPRRWPSVGTEDYTGQPRLGGLLNSSQALLWGWPRYMGRQREGETNSPAP